MACSRRCAQTGFAAGEANPTAALSPLLVQRWENVDKNGGGVSQDMAHKSRV